MRPDRPGPAHAIQLLAQSPEVVYELLYIYNDQYCCH